MVTYSGLARVAAVVAGELSKMLTPGHPAITALATVVRELKKLDGPDPMVRRAKDRFDNLLWQHGCGWVGTGTKVTDLPPSVCGLCSNQRVWRRLYVRPSDEPQ